jgi:preprotein translocase subunit YajC
MNRLINIALPIALFAIFYLIIKRVNFNDSKQIIFVKLRMFLGCIAIGVIISQAYLAESLRTIIPLILLSLVVFYGVVSMQKKYSKEI